MKISTADYKDGILHVAIDKEKGTARIAKTITIKIKKILRSKSIAKSIAKSF
jgi:hypothetical protein